MIKDRHIPHAPVIFSFKHKEIITDYLANPGIMEKELGAKHGLSESRVSTVLSAMFRLSLREREAIRMEVYKARKINAQRHKR